MELEEIILQMKKSNNFKIKEPCGLPKIMKNHIMPEDVKKFYSICGGIECYVEYGGFPLTILGPSEIKLANLILLGEQYEEDISSSWYVIADAEDGNYISIDFNRDRLGRCYESFEYSHAVKNNCPIIAKSFSELLINIFEYAGDYFFWKDGKTAHYYRDAYDNL